MATAASKFRVKQASLMLATSMAALAIGIGSPAHAQQVRPGVDPECTITASEAVCEGDLSDGITSGPNDPPFTTITIRNATGPIAPPGYFAIGIVKDSSDVTVNLADDLVINTFDDPAIANPAQGLFVQNTNGFGITIDSGATIETDGNGQPAAALEANILDGGGTIDVTNRGDLSVTTSNQFSVALLAR